MDRVIFIPTVQHTGTWFIIDFLRKHSKVNDEVFFWRDVRINLKTPPLKEGILDIMHVHIAGDRNQSWMPEPVDLKGKCHLPMIMDAFIDAWGAVIPLRDPLRAVITRQARHPGLDHTHMVSGYLYLAELWNRWANIIFIPIDTDIPLMERKILLIDALSLYNLETESYVKEYTFNWKAPDYNISSPTRLKVDYQVGNVEEMQKAIPKEWKALKDNEEVLRPFLEAMGYKDLMWFS